MRSGNKAALAQMESLEGRCMLSVAGVGDVAVRALKSDLGGLRSVRYLVNGVTETKRLGGRVNAGDLVEVGFVVMKGYSLPLTLVSYAMPSGVKEGIGEVFEKESKRFGAGRYESALSVRVPGRDFGLGFLLGKAPKQLSARDGIEGLKSRLIGSAEGSLAGKAKDVAKRLADEVVGRLRDLF